jgi:HEAT repeat protein
MTNDTQDGNPPEDWHLWLAALFDPDETNRAVAAQVLGSSGDPEAIPPLLAALDTVVGMVAGGGPVARALVELRDVWTVEIFAKALNDPRAYVRRAAAEALGWLRDPQALEALLGVLQDEAFGVRLEAAWALGEIGDPSALGSLLAMVKDRDSNVRRNVADALGQLGDPRAKEVLLGLLADEDLGVRAAAEGALKRLIPEAG